MHQLCCLTHGADWHSLLQPVRIEAMRPNHQPSAAPLLLVDAGNTRTKIGLFDSAESAAGTLPTVREWRGVLTQDPVDWEDLRQAVGEAAPSLVTCMTGSNPARVQQLLAEFPQDWPAPRSLPDRSRFPLRIDVDFPERVGIDRLLTAVAANRLRRAGQPAIVVDSGTASTVDHVSADGRFCGGAILPGFDLCARALHQYTARLPLVPLAPLLEASPDDVGRNTEAAIRSGLYWGHVGSVRELLRRLMHRAAEEMAGGDGRHLGNLAEADMPLVLITGGAAPLLTPHLPSIARHEPHLALQGLAVVVGEIAE